MKILVVEASEKDLKKLKIEVEPYSLSGGLLGAKLKKAKKGGFHYIIFIDSSITCITGVYRGIVIFRECGSLSVIERHVPGLLELIEKKL